MQGTVKWFSAEKGYGFISSESGIDHYFNVKNIIGANLPSNGDLVSFESQLGPKGHKAATVKIVQKNSSAHLHTNDRIHCPGCNKRIVPRLITYRGEPEKSVCPFCGITVKTFGSNPIIFISCIAIAIAVLWFFLR